VDYALVKAIHQGAVTLSVCGFFARGLGSLRGARWVQQRAAKTLPHIVDTVLLASAIGLAWMLRLNPAASPWLMAKIVGLVAYVGLGTVALRPSRPVAVRAAAWVAALATVGWIASVAIAKTPLGFLAWL
jgi:uncharacterized membrane protein SirB2